MYRFLVTFIQKTIKSNFMKKLKPQISPNTIIIQFNDYSCLWKS